MEPVPDADALTEAEAEEDETSVSSQRVSTYFHLRNQTIHGET
jgi:hypothetical protein